MSELKEHKSVWLGRERGFTIVELIVSIAVITIISTMLIANFRSGKERDELKGAGVALVQAIQQAQAYALAGHTVFDNVLGKTIVPPGGYGVYLDVANNAVIFFGDSGDRQYTKEAELAIEAVSLPSNVHIDGPGTCIDPTGQSSCGVAPFITYVTATPSGDHYLNGVVNAGLFRIKLTHTALGGKSLTVSGNAISGQVSASGITTP